MKKIGIMIERQRMYGRRLCEGVIRFARGRTDWALGFVDFDAIKHPARLSGYDGFIARIMEDAAEAALRATGKPVVDVFFEKPREGFGAADQNANIVGQMAALHFIEHCFTRFAFCGYNGRSYSDRRRDSFVQCLAQNHFKCSLYRTPQSALKDFNDSVILKEHFGAASDRRAMGTWITRLEKPVAIFCSHDMRAYQLLEVCRENGIRIPEDVALLGCDDDELVCQFTYPTLSSIDQNATGIGYAAAECLQQMLDKPGFVPPPALVEPIRLVERDSSRIYPIDPPWLSDAMIFIRRNIARNITATDVYGHVGKSHTLIDTAFRRTFRTSVQKTIIRERLAEAKRLLTRTDIPLTRIAELSGFATVQYFCTSFNAAFGLTPSDYRKRHGTIRHRPT